MGTMFGIPGVSGGNQNAGAMGSPADYEAARQAWLRQRAQAAQSPTLQGPSYGGSYQQPQSQQNPYNPQMMGGTSNSSGNPRMSTGMQALQQLRGRDPGTVFGGNGLSGPGSQPQFNQFQPQQSSGGGGGQQTTNQPYIPANGNPNGSTPDPSSGYPTMTPGYNSGGGYFTGGAPNPNTTPPETGGLQFPSPRSPYYNQNLGPALLGPTGPGQNPNSSYGQNWQNYSNPYDMMYNQYMGSQFGPQQQALWNQVGSNISQFQNNYSNYNNTADQMYTGNAYQNNAFYNPDEQNNMIRQQQFQSGMATPEQYASTYFSPDEQASINANPYAGSNYFNQQMGNAFGDQSNQENMTYDALAGQDTNMRNIAQGYGQSGNAALDSGTGAVRGAAYNPALQAQTGNMGLSDAFNSQYNFGDKDVADLENLAGTTAGKQIQGQSEDIERKAAEQGNTSPMALAAMKQRFANDAASQSADAATGARVQGRGLQLSTEANKEGMRLGAEQAKEGMRLSGADTAAGLQTGAEQNLLNSRLGFGQNLAGLQSGTEQYLGGSRLNAYSGLGSQRAGLNQFTAGMGGQFQAAGDTAASNRAAGIAGQRTQAAGNELSSRFQQNYDTNRQLAQGYTNVANQRLSGNQEQRGYFAGQAATNQGALQNATNAGTNFYTNYNNVGQSAANSYGSYDLNRRNQQLQQQQANWNRQYQGVGAAFGGTTP